MNHLSKGKLKRAGHPCKLEPEAAQAAHACKLNNFGIRNPTSELGQTIRNMSYPEATSIMSTAMASCFFFRPWLITRVLTSMCHKLQSLEAQNQCEADRASQQCSRQVDHSLQLPPASACREHPVVLEEDGHEEDVARIVADHLAESPSINCICLET